MRWLKKRVKKREIKKNRPVVGRKKEFYTTPGTFDIIENHPHKTETKTKKSWERELDDWVKKKKVARK